MEKHKKSFECTDSDGNSYIIREYVQILNVGATYGNSNETMEVRGRLILEDGSAVNDNGDGTFLIVDTGKIIRPV